MAEYVAVGILSNICAHRDKPENKTNRPELGIRLSPQTTSTSQAVSPKGPTALEIALKLENSCSKYEPVGEISNSNHNGNQIMLKAKAI